MAKCKMKPSEICVKTKFLEPFANEVYDLSFDEEPNYSHLKFLLLKNLLDLNIAPNG